jgi:hypothetical protein
MKNAEFFFAISPRHCLGQIKYHTVGIRLVILLNHTSEALTRHPSKRGQSTTQPTHFTLQLSRCLPSRPLHHPIISTLFQVRHAVIITQCNILSTSRLCHATPSRYLSINLHINRQCK